ncbi:MAG: alpha/beta fold hydrolase [Nanoarchaeota archaeon]|nr:alpha/beta fold hydrolase [Nanoarchaeota archaeon]
MQTLYFDNGSGTKLCGILKEQSKDKVVILCHGFSSSKDSSTYPRMQGMLAKRGISSFRFDFFGHGESEGKCEDITLSEGVRDLEAVIAFLESKGFSKIALFGNSFGGMIVLLVASRHPELKAVVGRAPVSSYIEKIVAQKSGEEIGEWKKKGYMHYLSSDGTMHKLNLTFLEDAEHWSVHDVAPKIKPPTLIIHGDKDDVVPVEQSIKSSGLIPDCRLKVIKGTGHAFEGHRQECLRMAIDFLDAHLHQ